MSGKNIMIYVFIFLLVLVPYLVLQILFSSKPRLNDSLSPEGRNLPPLLRLIWKPLVYLSEPMDIMLKMLSPEVKKTLENYLMCADIKMNLKQLAAAAVFLSVSFMALSVILVLCFTTEGMVLVPVAVVASVLGAMYPFTTVQDLAKKRQKAILRALPFSLDMICSAMRSGIDFNASVNHLVRSDRENGPLTVEFARMLQDLQLGRTRSDAINAMASRIQMEEFNAFAAAVSHSVDAGTSIVDTLKIQAKEMRRARFNAAERKAARAASAMIFPIVVFIMPAMILIIAAPIIMQVISSGAGDFLK